MRILAIVKRILMEMSRDKRTIAMMFLAPLFILTLIYFLFQSNTDQSATLAVQNADTQLVKAIDQDHIKIKYVATDKTPTHLIRNHNYAGVLNQKGDKLTLTLQNSDQSKSTILRQGLKAAQAKLKMQAAASTLKSQGQALQKLQQSLGNVQIASPGTSTAKAITTYQQKTHYLYGSSSSTFFDTLLPVLLGFVIFFFVFLISGIALLRERTTGTLNRLLATPVKRGEIISGYLLGYGIFALIQTLLIVAFTMYVFKIQILGSLWNVILINILLAVVALTLGLLISTFAATEFQMVQFIPLIIIPQIFFSGIFPLDQMASWLRPVAYIMPLYYGADAMSSVITQNAGFMAILPDLGILVLFAALFLGLNLVAMRRYREV
ncbi:ABC transporter permease [Agrilactobacillus yilanensis]|uniref:ABC transporter permease n=1 Tax=Agrilactobacillus yilanensis TaxID=2485997 RepID=A0ABW4J3X6_9LACO|nr:ABC transporter permease [Agrilactobacillus yilanensis]